MKTKPQPTDEEITIALIEGVMSAIPKGGNEHDVITFITPGMFMAFLRYVSKGDPKTPLSGKDQRIFGSRTVVVKRQGMWAASRATRRPKK